MTRYVEIKLRQQLPATYTLKRQAASQSLCTRWGKSMFQLQPDLLIQCGTANPICLSTKWKRIATSDTDNKYGLSQSDFYQMFAYGHKYLAAKGEMLLIYPYTGSFFDFLPSFDFSPDLKLWVVPFDLDNDKCTGQQH